jgi:hypothetical protein
LSTVASGIAIKDAKDALLHLQTKNIGKTNSKEILLTTKAIRFSLEEKAGKCL